MCQKRTIQRALAQSDVDRLDAEVLLAHICGKDRSWLLAHPEVELTRTQVEQLEAFLHRRRTGEPVAYLIGEKEFYGRRFIVNSLVLIPRPSTEGLVDLALDFLKTGKEEEREVDTGIVAVSKRTGSLDDVSTVVDVGTGSGCIAITLALERPHLCFIATDVSAASLKTAKRNADRHGVTRRIEFREGDLLAPVSDLTVPFIVVSNPPYVPEGERLPPEVKDFESVEALVAGSQGTDILRDLLTQAMEHPLCRGVVVECKAEHTQPNNLSINC